MKRNLARVLLVLFATLAFILFVAGGGVKLLFAGSVEVVSLTVWQGDSTGFPLGRESTEIYMSPMLLLLVTLLLVSVSTALLAPVFRNRR
jgi:hypothetical protein